MASSSPRRVDQREAMEMVAPPRRPHLRGVPLAVGRAREPFVPDRKREVEDLLEQRAFGEDELSLDRPIVIAGIDGTTVVPVGGSVKS